MRFLLLLLSLASGSLYANGYVVTTSGGAPLPIAFNASNSQSNLGKCQGNVIEIINYVDVPVAVGLGTSNEIPSKDFAYVPTGPGSVGRYKPKGGTSSEYVYVRAAGGSTGTSGLILVSCYYEEKP